MSMAGMWIAKLRDPANVPLHNEIGMRAYVRGSLGTGDIPAQPEWPYLMYAFEESLAVKAIRETADAEVYPGRIYVYDKPGSYVRIKRIHRLVKQTLVVLVGTSDADGTFCYDLTYEGRSGEQYDPVQKQAVMVATYRVVSTD